MLKTRIRNTFPSWSEKQRRNVAMSKGGGPVTLLSVRAMFTRKYWKWRSKSSGGIKTSFERLRIRVRYVCLPCDNLLQQRRFKGRNKPPWSNRGLELKVFRKRSSIMHGKMKYCRVFRNKLMKIENWERLGKIFISMNSNITLILFNSWNYNE